MKNCIVFPQQHLTCDIVPPGRVVCQSKNLAPSFWSTLKFLIFTKNFKVLAFPSYILRKILKRKNMLAFSLYTKRVLALSNYILEKFKVSNKVQTSFLVYILKNFFKKIKVLGFYIFSV